MAKPIQRRRAVRPPAHAADGTQESEREDLLPEVPAVQRPPEYRLVHLLQLAQRELAWQERVDQVGVLELGAQPAGRRRDDGGMVVGERRQLAAGPPGSGRG